MIGETDRLHEDFASAWGAHVGSTIRRDRYAETEEVLHGLLEPLVSFRQELPVRPKARATRNADAGAVELECRRADAAVQVGGRHGGTIDRTPLELKEIHA